MQNDINHSGATTPANFNKSVILKSSAVALGRIGVHSGSCFKCPERNLI